MNEHVITIQCYTVHFDDGFLQGCTKCIHTQATTAHELTTKLIK